MNKLLKKLYDTLYTPPPAAEANEVIEDCHKQLIETLDKAARKLVLCIIDEKDLIANERSFDSFVCGFYLAWQLATELRYYQTSSNTTNLSTIPTSPTSNSSK